MLQVGQQDTPNPLNHASSAAHTKFAGDQEGAKPPCGHSTLAHRRHGPSTRWPNILTKDIRSAPSESALLRILCTLGTLLWGQIVSHGILKQ